MFTNNSSNVVIDKNAKTVTFYAGFEIDALPYASLVEDKGTGNTTNFAQKYIADAGLTQNINIDLDSDNGYTIIVKGDVNGDAAIDAADLALIQAHIASADSALEGDYLTAANVAAPNNRITARDYGIVSAFIDTDLAAFQK